MAVDVVLHLIERDNILVDMPVDGEYFVVEVGPIYDAILANGFITAYAVSVDLILLQIMVLTTPLKEYFP